MKPDKAIAELLQLKAQADAPEVRRGGPEHNRWRSSVLAVMQSSLPASSGTTTQFSAVRYHVGVYSGSPGEAARDATYFAARVDDAAGFIAAAIYELGLLVGDGEVAAASYESELWGHVRHSVEEERWNQVASDAAIFVEDKVRRWSGRPTDASGRALVGKDLFGKAFGVGGPLVLGSQANEAEGWRFLALGFASALGNVDRHNIQDRSDIKQYALGVLGLASLLLTQISHTHPQVVAASGSST